MANEYAGLLPHLIALYGAEEGSRVYPRLCNKLTDFLARIGGGNKKTSRGSVSERDAILITYGDQVQEPAMPPLRSLVDFCHRYLRGVVSGIHILPFYPFSSDDGFSVIDYFQVDPALGEWEDIRALGGDFRLMFDAVINHLSVQSSWFQGFLSGDAHYQDFFITVDGDPDLSQVIRPRTLPLLTSFDVAGVNRKVWTTFSADQVDLNYRSPEVLLAVVDVLLHYAAQGASFIRLDAIAFLWKEIGTSCLHLPQTHRIIQLLRAVLDAVAPQVLLITETNVPHLDNLSYFGDGYHEAQMVYNFALPPLVLHTMHTGCADALSHWAAGLSLPSPHITFFNFLASHDGIGLNPVRGILRDAEVDALVASAREYGGYVSEKNNLDGSRSPYELNINFFDALSNLASSEPLSLQTDRFMAAQAIMLAMPGVPGIYFHSLFGSRGWVEGVQQTGRYRTINRQKLSRQELEKALNSPDDLRCQIFYRYRQMLELRSALPAFSPSASHRVLEVGEGIFALQRETTEMGCPVLCLVNVTNRPQRIQLREPFSGRSCKDCLSGLVYQAKSVLHIDLQPYQVSWLTNQ